VKHTLYTLGSIVAHDVALGLLRKILQAPAFDIKAYQDDELNHRDIRLILACVPCYCEVIELLFTGDKEREEAFQKYVSIRKSLLASSLLTGDIKKVITNSETYMGLQLT